MLHDQRKGAAVCREGVPVEIERYMAGIDVRVADAVAAGKRDGVCRRLSEERVSRDLLSVAGAEYLGRRRAEVVPARDIAIVSARRARPAVGRSSAAGEGGSTETDRREFKPLEPRSVVEHNGTSQTQNGVSSVTADVRSHAALEATFA